MTFQTHPCWLHPFHRALAPGLRKITKFLNVNTWLLLFLYTPSKKCLFSWIYFKEIIGINESSFIKCCNYCILQCIQYKPLDVSWFLQTVCILYLVKGNSWKIDLEWWMVKLFYNLIFYLLLVKLPLGPRPLVAKSFVEPHLFHVKPYEWTHLKE